MSPRRLLLVPRVLLDHSCVKSEIGNDNIYIYVPLAPWCVGVYAPPRCRARSVSYLAKVCRLFTFLKSQPNQNLPAGNSNNKIPCRVQHCLYIMLQGMFLLRQINRTRGNVRCGFCHSFVENNWFVVFSSRHT